MVAANSIVEAFKDPEGVALGLRDPLLGFGQLSEIRGHANRNRGVLV